MTIANAEFSLGEVLGRGGEAVVHRLKNRPSEVLKIFKKPLAEDERRRIQSLIARGSRTLRRHAAWPLQLVSWNGSHALLLPLVAGAREIHELYDYASRIQHFPDSDWASAIRTARDIARGCAVLHREGFVIVDLSERNILVNRSGRPTLIDCDSFVTKLDGLRPVSTLRTLKYLAPELARVDLRTAERTANHDNFALACVLFKLLFQGSDPMLAEDSAANGVVTPWPIFAFDSKRTFPGRPRSDELRLEDVSPKVAELFGRAFQKPQHIAWQSSDASDENSIVETRPTAVEWESALGEMLAGMRSCARVKGHSYYNRSVAGCPWCARAQQNPAYDLFRSSRPTGPTLSDEKEATVTKVVEPAPPPRKRAWLVRHWRVAIVLTVLVLVCTPRMMTSAIWAIGQELGGLWGRATSPQVSAQERSAWREAGEAPSPNGYVTYLKAWPTGAFAREAQQQLQAWGEGLALHPCAPRWRAVTSANIRTAPSAVASLLATLPPGKAVDVAGQVIVHGRRWLVIDWLGHHRFSSIRGYERMGGARDAEAPKTLDEPDVTSDSPANTIGGGHTSSTADAAAEALRPVQSDPSSSSLHVPAADPDRSTTTVPNAATGGGAGAPG